MPVASESASFEQDMKHCQLPSGDRIQIGVKDRNSHGIRFPVDVSAIIIFCTFEHNICQSERTEVPDDKDAKPVPVD